MEPPFCLTITIMAQDTFASESEEGYPCQLPFMIRDKKKKPILKGRLAQKSRILACTCKFSDVLESGTASLMYYDHS